MCLMLDNPELRAIPDLRQVGGQAAYEAEPVQRYQLGDASILRDLRHPARQLVRALAAQRAVP